MAQNTGTTKVYCNNHLRDVLYYCELTDAQRAEADDTLDYLAQEERECREFYIYRGRLYCDEDFMAVHNSFYNPRPPEYMLPYDGYLTDTFFSAVLMRYPKDDCGDIDTEHVVMATAIAG